jgi:hypothetical protein
MCGDGMMLFACAVSGYQLVQKAWDGRKQGWEGVEFTHL